MTEIHPKLGSVVSLCFTSQIKINNAGTMWGNMYQSELCEVMPVNDTKTNLGQLNTEQHKCSDNSHCTTPGNINNTIYTLDLEGKVTDNNYAVNNETDGFLKKCSL